MSNSLLVMTQVPRVKNRCLEAESKQVILCSRKTRQLWCDLWFFSLIDCETIQYFHHRETKRGASLTMGVRTFIGCRNNTISSPVDWTGHGDEMTWWFFQLNPKNFFQKLKRFSSYTQKLMENMLKIFWLDLRRKTYQKRIFIFRNFDFFWNRKKKKNFLKKRNFFLFFQFQKKLLGKED